MTTVPPAEIADATTFASSLTVQGAFTSVGIDDNGNATAITIDSSENILAGKTSSAFNTAGFELFGNADKGKFWATRDGGVAAAFNRKSSDGDIALFAKDGGTVGSIYNGGGNLGVNSSGGLLLVDDIITPTSGADATHDIGRSSARYKDLYLSGGVYLGGVGSANKLDDYETGTWTPAFVSGTFSYGIRTGWYTKVGDLVTCGFLIIWSSKSGSGTINITLPFTTSSGTHYRYAGTTGYMSGVDIGSSYKDFTFTTTPSTANVALVLNGDNIAGAGAQVANMSGSGEIQGSISFKV
jgi:hypothetical protein